MPMLKVYILHVLCSKGEVVLRHLCSNGEVVLDHLCSKREVVLRPLCSKGEVVLGPLCYKGEVVLLLLCSYPLKTKNECCARNILVGSCWLCSNKIFCLNNIFCCLFCQIYSILKNKLLSDYRQ